MSVNFVFRDCFDIDVSELDNFLELNKGSLKNIILNLTIQEKVRTIDVGAWCYYKKGKRNSYNKVTPVDIDSLNESRIKGIEKIVTEFIDSTENMENLRNKLKNMMSLINFLDTKYPIVDISDFSEAIVIYQEYTNELIKDIKIREASGNSSYIEKMSVKQSMLANFLSLSTNEDKIKFESSIRKIKQIRAKNPIKINKSFEDINEFVAIQLEIFKSISNNIINEKKLPFVIDLSEFKKEKYIFDIDLGIRDKFLETSFYYDQEFNILELSEFKEKLGSLQEVNDGKMKKDGLIYGFKRRVTLLEKENDNRFSESNMKIKLSNLAIMSFAKVFIAVTGVNESVLYDLKVEDFKNIASTKGKRAYGKKPRANNKKVSIEFGVKFKKYFENYLKFRGYLLSQFSKNLIGDKSNHLFFSVPANYWLSIPKFCMINNKNFSKHNEKLKAIFDIESIGNRDLRSNVANCYLNITNDSLLTSQKLSNSVETLNKSYSSGTFEEMADQLSNYFDAVEQTNVFRMRNKKQIDVQIVEDENLKKIDTPIGNCSSENPKLKNGFNEYSIQPDCARLESCLFCEYYILNLNETDIRKILSLKFIFENIPNLNQQTSQVIYRINEIVEYMKSKNKKTIDLIGRVENETEEGFLDGFWENHLSMLVDMEVI